MTRIQFKPGAVGMALQSDRLSLHPHAKLVGSPPVNSVAPAITGTPSSSNTLTCSTGTWSGTPTFTYRWYRDNLPMLGEIGNTLTVISPYIGSVVFCLVTATNAGGVSSMHSNSVTIIP